MKIMIIDDEAQITTMLQKALSKNSDFDISVFNNPLDALRQLVRINPEIVLLDIMMPQMDGIAVLNKIKKESTGAKVIMMTAYSTLDRVLSSHKQGADDYILKPFESLTVVEQKIMRTFGGGE
jgi:DNA-binding response OmpR family regulator